MNTNNKLNVLMVGPGRSVKGGISTVVNSYYTADLDKTVNLKYIATMEDGSKIKKLFVAMRSYLSFCRCIKNYDIVHIHMAAQASFDRKSLFVRKAKKAGKKIIIHQHSADFDKYFDEQVDNKKRENIRNIFEMADVVIVLSEEWAEYFGNSICNKEKIRILYNGVLMPEYIKEDYSNHNILMLGRLGKRKGTYDLLQAMPGVVKTVPDVVLYLGGDGDIEECKKIVSENGLQDHVKFLGWVRNEQKEDYLKKCSVFILPSYHEGMPMSVLEAMSYGLATISTNAGGIPQIIEQGVNGIRVEAGDTKAIEEGLVSVLSDEKKRQALGRAGRMRIKEKFDFRVTIKNLLKLYSFVSESN